MVGQALVVCVMAPPIYLGAWSMALLLWLPIDIISEVLCRICAVQRPITNRQLGGHVSTADSAQPKKLPPDPFPLVGGVWERDYKKACKTKASLVSVPDPHVTRTKEGPLGCAESACSENR